MSKILSNLLLVFLLFSNVYCSAQEKPYIYPGDSWEEWEEFESAGYSSDKMQEARRFIIDGMNTTGLVVIVGGKILGDYGDIEELSYLASCRKSILAMLYGNYVADGTINLDITLDELGIDDHGGLLDVEKEATIRNLITARSGIYHPASNSGDNSADAPERGSQKPGEYFLYNNWDFNAAGAIFEQTSGKNIYDALRDDLAIPIQMEDFDRGAQRKSGNLEVSKYPAYHIWLSTRDMARIGYLMLRHGKWNDTQVIPENWAKEIVSVVTPIEEMNPQRYKEGHFGYGFMWWLWQGDENVGAFEGAYSARGAYGQYITVLPALDMVVAHKTKSQYRRSTRWSNYEKLLNMIVEAKID